MPQRQYERDSSNCSITKSLLLSTISELNCCAVKTSPSICKARKLGLSRLYYWSSREGGRGEKGLIKICPLNGTRIRERGNLLPSPPHTLQHLLAHACSCCIASILCMAFDTHNCMHLHLIGSGNWRKFIKHLMLFLRKILPQSTSTIQYNSLFININTKAICLYKVGTFIINLYSM